MPTTAPTAQPQTPAPGALVMSAPPINPATGLPPPPAIQDAGVYYLDGGRYLVRVPDGRYITMARQDLRPHLIKLGFSPRVAPGSAVSEVDDAIHRVQTEMYVTYAGPLAGKPAGVHEMLGQRILVTTSPQIILPDASVEHPTIRTLLETMLGEAQLPYFYGWAAHAYTSLVRFEPSHGQALALVGPRDSGKTLLQTVIRAILGGRETSPYGWMAGRTDFNGSMFESEVLSFGDEVSARDYRARVRLGDCIKQIVVNDVQTCHRKGREKISLTPWWRCVFSLNDDPIALEVLPPLASDGMSDKIMLLRCVRPGVVFDSNPWATSSRSENWGRIENELPGFVSFLSRYEIPPALRDTRLGVKAYQSPEVLADVSAESAEMRVLELVDEAGICLAPETGKFHPDKPPAPRAPAPWVGTASELERALFESPVGAQARRILDWSNAAGVYLSSLCRSVPNRVRKLPRSSKVNRYEILPEAA